MLNIEVKSGNSKIKLLQELSIFCKWHKEGHKYIIDEVYKNPMITLNDLTKTKNNKYIKLLSNIIIEYLYNNPKELQQIPLLKLFSILGVTNNDYINGNQYKKELSQLLDIQLASVYYFYSNTRNEYKRIIERCLNNLQNRRVLNWNKCVIIIDKENKRLYKADEETQKEILNMEKQTLQYLNINNMYQLMQDKSKLKEFNKILKSEMGFQYYYAYDLIIGDIALRIEYDNVQNEKLKLNNLIVDRTNKMFDKSMFLAVQDDYKTLIDVLVSKENNKDIKHLLEDKHKENLLNYVCDRLELDKNYVIQVAHIKDKYLDKYNIE